MNEILMFFGLIANPNLPKCDCDDPQGCFYHYNDWLLKR